MANISVDLIEVGNFLKDLIKHLKELKGKVPDDFFNKQLEEILSHFSLDIKESQLLVFQAHNWARFDLEILDQNFRSKLEEILNWIEQNPSQKIEAVSSDNLVERGRQLVTLWPDLTQIELFRVNLQNCDINELLQRIRAQFGLIYNKRPCKFRLGTFLSILDIYLSQLREKIDQANVASIASVEELRRELKETSTALEILTRHNNEAIQSIRQLRAEIAALKLEAKILRAPLYKKYLKRFRSFIRRVWKMGTAQNMAKETNAIS